MILQDWLHDVAIDGVSDAFDTWIRSVEGFDERIDVVQGHLSDPIHDK